MKLRHLFSSLMVSLLVLTTAQPVARAADKFELQDTHNIGDVITQFVGKPVKVVLKSGHELSGMLTKFSSPGHLIHLSALTGAEFYDAVIRADEVAAIVIRTK
jgi:hypothetical protein